MFMLYPITVNLCSVLFKVSTKHVDFPLLLIFGVVLSSQCRVTSDADSISDTLLRPEYSMTEEPMVSQAQYKCLEMSNKDHQGNRTGEKPKLL